jgi:hypothetical protein
MQKKLDYRAVGKDARASFAAHREAIVAIAGFFIFLANWIAGYLAPPLVLDSFDDTTKVIAAFSGYFESNWPVLLPAMLVTMYGSLVLYVLISGRKLTKVGDALGIAAALFLTYLTATILTGWATFAGFFLFIIPGLYLTGRFAVLPAVIAQEPALGITNAVKRTWETTRNCGWAILILMLFIAVAIRLVSGIAGDAVAGICHALAGEGGVPVVEAAVSAFFAAVEAVIYVVVLTALNRQLGAQTASQ